MIVWNNISSVKYGMNLLADIKFDSIEQDVELIEIPGRDGAIVIDNGRKKPVELSLEFTIRFLNTYQNIEAQIKDIFTWLFNMSGFKHFEWVGEPDYIFMAKINGKATVNRSNPDIALITVPIKLHPTKFLKSNFDTPRILKSGEAFQNKGTQIAYPIITLAGTGNVTLTVNGNKFILKNITGGVVIDCDNQVVTDTSKKHSQMDKVYSYPFPNLKTGSNTISWDNAEFTGTIIERWCELA
ncbi:phage-like protein [Lactococcus garvieae]|uniref:Phage-like protein n=1 Tax=Lactococcus garvieae DCC43 TaxID=1231377 RepID=K2QA93_9LACT|nr:phage-like protein [Lactococcus garvieae]EKF50442.1 Phage-like protein [Lactococcus garvieae DCC43]